MKHAAGFGSHEKGSKPAVWTTVADFRLTVDRSSGVTISVARTAISPPVEGGFEELNIPKKST